MFSLLFTDYIKKNKMRFALLVVNIVLISLIKVPLPYFSKIIIDNVLNEHEYNLIFPIIILFVIIMVLQIFFGWVNAIQSSNFFQNFIFTVRDKIFCKAVKNISIDNSKLGFIQTIMTNDIEILSSNYSTIISTFFSSIILIVSYTVILFLINVKLAVICILFVPFYILWTLFMGEKIKIVSKKSQEYRGQLISVVNHFLCSLVPIHIYSYFENVNKEFKYVNKNNEHLNRKLLKYQSFFNIISSTIVALAAFLPFFVGIFFVLNDNLSVGELIAFNGYAMSLFTPLTGLINLLVLIKSSDVYDKRINMVVDAQEENEIRSLNINNLNLETNLLVIDELELKDINNNVLLNCKNFCIDQGEIILLKGDNGKGKSLFLKSIVGIYKNFTGSILLNGADVTNVDTSVISTYIIYVDNSQPFVLEDFYTEITVLSSYNVDIQSVFEVVGLNSQNNYNDLSRDILNSNKSTGELQLLRIVRALLKKPDIIILDEVFSNIAQKKVDSIIEAIKNNFPELSLIIVEHHLENECIINRKYVISDNILSERI